MHERVCDIQHLHALTYSKGEKTGGVFCPHPNVFKNRTIPQPVTDNCRIIGKFVRVL